MVLDDVLVVDGLIVKLSDIILSHPLAFVVAKV